MGDMRILTEETRKNVFQLRGDLSLFDDRTSYFEHMLYTPYDAFVNYLYEQIKTADAEDVWEIQSAVSVARVRALITFYRSFLGILASYATDCTNATVRDKSKVIIAHLRRIGGNCESLTNDRGTRNAMAMLERVFPLVQELNVKNTVVDPGDQFPRVDNLVVAGGAIGCQMATILIALAMAKPVAMPAA